MRLLAVVLAMSVWLGWNAVLALGAVPESPLPEPASSARPVTQEPPPVEVPPEPPPADAPPPTVPTPQATEAPQPSTDTPPQPVDPPAEEFAPVESSAPAEGSAPAAERPPSPPLRATVEEAGQPVAPAAEPPQPAPAITTETPEAGPAAPAVEALPSVQQPGIGPAPDPVARPRPAATRSRERVQPPPQPDPFSACREDPQGNPCEQLAAECHLTPAQAECRSIRDSCEPHVFDPNAGTDFPECAVYELVAFCLERPLSVDCNRFLREPCARDGRLEPDNSPACEVREFVARKRQIERERQQGGEQGGETPTGRHQEVLEDPAGLAPSPGPVSGPVVAAALLVQLREELDEQIIPRPSERVTLVFTRGRLSGRQVILTLDCPAAGHRGSVSLRARRDAAVLGRARFVCRGEGTIEVRVILGRRELKQLRHSGRRMLWASIVQRSQLGDKSSSSERIVLVGP